MFVVALATLALAVGAGTAAAGGGHGGLGPLGGLPPVFGFGGGGNGLKGLAASLKAKSAFDADVAKRLGTTVAKLNDAIKSAAKAQIDAAREDDDITADEAATLKAAIDDGSLSAKGLGRASAVASALGTTTAKLNEAYREARRAQALARVNEALADGDLEDDEAAELKERIEDADFPGYSGGRGFGFGFGFEYSFAFGKHRR
jgi:anti-sigma28 factor (negative regulator of flagellin synthesis)